MSGFATDTTIDDVMVELNNGTYVHVRLEYDGVNPEPSVSCQFEEGNEVIDLPHFTHTRTVLTDGISEPDPDAFGRSWPGVPESERCRRCGQPDNCGDCDHTPLSDEEAKQLGAVGRTWWQA